MNKRQTLGLRTASLLIVTAFAFVASPVVAEDDDCAPNTDAIVCETGVPTVPVDDMGSGSCELTDNLPPDEDCGGVRIFYACTGTDYTGSCWAATGAKCVNGNGADYANPTMSPDMDDNLESAVKMGSCDQKYFWDVNYGGTPFWCRSTCPNFGSNTNVASSFKLY